MPLRPRKCCGKKVTLTEINIRKKCAKASRELRVSPVITGNQKVNPANTANTAPIDRT